MKIRKGFVSNSSSSSFILPVNGDSDKFTITITLDDLKRMMSSGESHIRGPLTTIEEIGMHIAVNYGWRGQSLENLLEEDEYAAEKYDELLAIINSGKSVLVGNIDNDDSALATMIKHAGGKIED